MAGDFDVSQPTAGELVRDCYAHADAIERGLERLKLGNTPRYAQLLVHLETHMANAVSALNAAIAEAHRTEDPYEQPGPLPPFHKTFRRTEPDGTPAST